MGFRLDDSISAIFDAAVAAAADEVPPGTKFTASDYLRGLFLRDAAARGLIEAKPKAKGNGAAKSPPAKRPAPRARP